VLVHARYARRSRSYRKAVHNIDRLSTHTLRFSPRRRARATRAKNGTQSRQEETTPEIRGRGLRVPSAGIISTDKVGNASVEGEREDGSFGKPTQRHGGDHRQSLAPYLISTPLSRGLSPIDRSGTSVGSEPLFRQMLGTEILGSTPWRSDSG
jgi:hypothetical protein